MHALAGAPESARINSRGFSNPDTAVCWRCKNHDKKQGVVVSNCTVRACAVERGYDSCIERDELTRCDKDLWTRFPEFYKAVKEMQIKYKEQIA